MGTTIAFAPLLEKMHKTQKQTLGNIINVKVQHESITAVTLPGVGER
jgi:hypothetical protein